MAMNSIGLGFVFTAKNLASGTIGKLARDFRSLDRAVDKSAAKIRRSIEQKLVAGTALVTTGALGMKKAFELATDFGNFDEGMARVYAVTGATREQMDKLKESVIQAGVETVFSPDEAVEGMNQLVTRGLTVTEAIESLTPALSLAAAGQMSIAQAGATTASALKVFGLQADQAANSADKLLKIETLTALKSKDLEIALGTVGRGAGLTNQSLEETMIMLGLVRNTGLETSAASTAVSTSLLMMAKNGAKLKDQLGVPVTDANGKFRDMGDIVLDVGKKLEKDFPDQAERAAKAAQLFNMRGLTGFGAVYKQLSSGVRTSTGELLHYEKALAYLRGSMKNTTGVAEDFKNKLQDTFAGEIDLLRGVGRTFILSIGEPFANVLGPVLAKMRAALIALQGVVQAMPDGLKNFMAGVFVVSSVLVGLTGAVLLGVAAFQALSLAAPLITAAFAPILPFVLPVIAGLAAAALGIKAFSVAVENNLGGIGDFFKQGAENYELLRDAFMDLVNFGEARGSTLERLLEFEPGTGVRAVYETIATIYDRFSKFFSGIKTGFNEMIAASSGTFASVKNAFASLGEAIGYVVATFTSLFGSTDQASEGGSRLGQVFGGLATFIADVVGHVASFAAGFIQGFNVILRIAAPALKMIKNAIGEVIDAFGHVIQSFGFAGEGGMQMNDIFATVGVVVGGFVTKGLIPLINMLGLVASVIAAVAHGIGGMISFFVNGIRALGHVVTGVLKLLTGDFEGFKLYMKKAGRALLDAIMSPFKGLVRMFKAIIDPLVDYVADVILQLVELGAPVPSGMAAFAKSRQATGRTKLKFDRDTASAISAKAGIAQNEGNAAVAADQQKKDGQLMSAQAAQSAFQDAMRAQAAKRSGPITINAALDVDGERMAEKVIKVKNGTDAADGNANSGL